MLWIWLTLGAAASQTARNALQSGLVAAVGTLGATQVRFMFGLPFALLFLAIVAMVLSAQGDSSQLSSAITSASSSVIISLIVGSIFQILATAFMLSAMEKQSFVVVTAITKTEPVLVALFGFLVLGDSLSSTQWLAVALATLGVVLFSWPTPQRSATELIAQTKLGAFLPALLPALMPGLIAASCFAVSVLGFRSAVIGLSPDASFYVRAILVLVAGQMIQTVLLATWIAVFQPERMMQLLNAWRPSLLAGFFGASASAFWYTAFSLQSAALVRTVGLIEIIFALLVTRQIFKKKTSGIQLIGLTALALGVGILVARS